MSIGRLAEVCKLGSDVSKGCELSTLHLERFLSVIALDSLSALAQDKVESVKERRLLREADVVQGLAVSHESASSHDLGSSSAVCVDLRIRSDAAAQA
jgi:hypothetical protein